MPKHEEGKIVYEEKWKGLDLSIQKHFADRGDVFYMKRPIPMKSTNGKSGEIKVGDALYNAVVWNPKTKNSSAVGAIDLKSAKKILEDFKKNPEGTVKVEHKGKNVKLREVLKGYDSTSSIEPEIRDVVYTLNEAGYETQASCSGHAGIKSATGWISFVDIFDDEELKEVFKIMRKHGLKPSKKKMKIEGGSTLIGFSPIGKPLTKAEIKRFEKWGGDENVL